MRLSGTVPEQRQWHGPMFSPVNTRLVHAIKHHINIRYHPRVPSKKLQQTPDRKHGSALHTRIVQINKQFPTNYHDPESSEFPGFHQMGIRDSGPGPRFEIPMDPPEEFRACLTGSTRTKTTPSGGVPATSEVRAMEDLEDPSLPSLLGEGFWREKVPRRGLKIVADDGLGLGGEVVSLFDKMPQRIKNQRK